MLTALNYIFESSLCLGLMVMFYRLWLKKEPVLWFNRLYLLMVLVFSATIPLVHFSFDSFESSTSTLTQVADNSPNGYYMLETVNVWGSQTQNHLFEQLQNLPWIKLIYLTGVIALFIKLLWALYKIRGFKLKGVVERNNNIAIVEIKDDLAPFSFFNIIFINRNKYFNDELKTIIDHELAHIRLKHSYDTLLVQLILILQWFNPFVWLLRNDLKEIHEFQADYNALQLSSDQAQYRQLLVDLAIGTRVELVNYFSQSLIKKRLKMMKSNNPNSPSFIKLVAVIVLTGTIVMSFGYDNLIAPPPPPPITQDPVPAATTKELPPPPPTPMIEISKPTANTKLMPPPPPPAAQDTVPPPPSSKPYEEAPVYKVVEQMPEFIGGQQGLMKYLSENVKYPEQAIKDSIQGTAYVNFIINNEGRVINTKLLRSAHVLLDEEAIRVVNSMPAWKPGMHQGVAVSTQYNLPIRFVLKKRSNEIKP